MSVEDVLGRNKTCFLCVLQFQLVSGAANAGGSPQVVQISQGQGGQRLAVPLKLLLQPQVRGLGNMLACFQLFHFGLLFMSLIFTFLTRVISSQTSVVSSAGGTVSVVKVINTSAAGSAATTNTTAASSGVRLAKVQEPVRKVETLCKQEKANRIVAEAIARAKARGERNIPRVLNQDELPAGQTSADLEGAAGAAGAKKKGGGGGGGGSKKKSPSAGGGKVVVGGDKKSKAKTPGTGGGVVGGSKSKSKTKLK